MKICYSIPFVIWTFAIQVVEAQKGNYQKGYIVTHENDTVGCLLQKRNWKKQPLEIKVRAGAKNTIITPQSVKGFIIPSLELNYISREISLTRYIDNLQNATTLKQPEEDTLQIAFLKVLHRGTFNLYLYLDGLSQKHFFVEAPDNFIEIYVHYYIYPGASHRAYDVPVTILDKQFEFVLKTLMTPCRNVFSIIENIQLNEDHLIGLFEIYDKCMTARGEN